MSGLSVVNEMPERGVALVQEYIGPNQILTKQDGQKPPLLHDVSEHRRQFPDYNKGAVTKHQ